MVHLSAPVADYEDPLETRRSVTKSQVNSFQVRHAWDDMVSCLWNRIAGRNVVRMDIWEKVIVQWQFEGFGHTIVSSEGIVVINLHQLDA